MKGYYMKKIQKWIKQYRGAAVLLGLGILTLIIYGSFAAYTSFNSVKRVVSTGTQSDTMFGSNYLSPLNLSDTNYPVKRISLSDDTNCTFRYYLYSNGKAAVNGRRRFAG